MVEWIACVSNWKGTSFWRFVGFNHSAALVAGFSFFHSPKMFVWLWNCGVLGKTTVTLFDHVKSLYNLIIALTFMTWRSICSSHFIRKESCGKNSGLLWYTNIDYVSEPLCKMIHTLSHSFLHLSVYACFADGCVIKCCNWQTSLNSALTISYTCCPTGGSKSPLQRERCCFDAGPALTANSCRSAILVKDCSLQTTRTF